MSTQNDIQNFVEKIKKMEKGEKLDLSSGEDLSIAIMNLISIEEHLFFSGNKTGKNEYFIVLDEVRKMRKQLLKRLIKDYEGEVWCISKHLLAASMRLMEVGTKMLGKGDMKESEDLFRKSYQLYSLFWGLNTGVVKIDDVKHEDSQTISFLSDDKRPKVRNSVHIFEKLGKIIQKVLDCCKE